MGEEFQLAADEEDENAAHTIRLVNSIIQRAYTEKASDIHLEPMGTPVSYTHLDVYKRQAMFKRRRPQGLWDD